MNFARNVGDRIRALRVQRNWSQEDLAEVAGLHRTYISGVERATRNPTLSSIVRIATALGVEPWQLLQVDRDTP